MNFEKDIFISYAHMDETSVDKEFEGWISIFHETLQSYVATKWGNEPVIWRDNSMQGNTLFSKEILSQFSRLKLFVSIITPRYLKSEWCQRELDTFFETAEQTGGLSIDNKTRLFKIIKTPVDRFQQPEKLREILEYPFYQKDPKTNKPKEFKLEFGNEFRHLFYQMVDDVAHDIAQLLNKLGEPNNNGKASKGKIYLAETTGDLKNFRDEIKRQYEDEGYTVYPNKNLTLEAADKFITEVETFMKECSLSVHLIGHEDYGIVPGKTEKSILTLQNEVAGRLSAAKLLDRLIWIAPPPQVDTSEMATTVADKRLESFLEQLKVDEELHHNSDLLEGTIDGFKQAIADTLRKQEENRLLQEKVLENERLKAALEAQVNQSLSCETDDTPKSIYLICDQRDVAGVKVIDDFLYDLGYNTIPSVFGGTPDELSKAHEDSLRDCDALVIYYGNANDAWLRIKISELKKKPALKGTRKLVASMIYVADATSNPQKEGFRTRDVHFVEKEINGFNPDLLKAFTEKLT